MSSPISQSTRQAPLAPQRPVAQAQPNKAMCRVGSDRLDLGRSLPPSLIEADLRLSMIGGPQLAADGQVTIQKAFVERLLRHALGGSPDIKDARIGFEAATGSYSVEAKIAIKGIQVPLSIKFAPMVDQNQVSFQLREVAIPTRFGTLEANLITRKVTEAIAHEMSVNGYRNSTDAKRGIVRLDVNGLLGQLGVLPSFASLDLDKTRLSASVSPTGNVVVGMASTQHAPEIPGTSASDIALFADGQGLQQALRGALGPDYEVQKITLDHGSLKLDGQAEFKEGSDFLTGAKGLLLLLAVAARSPAANQISPTPERMMVPLSLDIKQDGTQFVITPSIGKALESLTDSLKKAGFTPVPDGKGVRIDLNEVWKDNCAIFDQVGVQPEGAAAKLRLDLDSFFDTPWLKKNSDA
ncbi:MAG TPA: hypothetical protein V6D05_10935 [Stenomitos sp.]